MRGWSCKAHRELLSDENPVSPPVTYRSRLGEILGLLKSAAALPLAFFQARGCIPVLSNRWVLSLWHLAGAVPALAVAHTNHHHPTGPLKRSSAFCDGKWHQSHGFRRGVAFVSQSPRLYESAEYHLFSCILDKRFMLATKRKFYLHARPFL